MKKILISILTLLLLITSLVTLCSCQDEKDSKVTVSVQEKNEKYGYCEHKWEQQSKTLPNCTNEGAIAMKCTYCGERKSITIPATGECEFEMSWEYKTNSSGFGALCLTCPINPQHSFRQTATVYRKSYTKGTCQINSSELYTCVAYFGGKEYTHEFTVYGMRTNHSYENVTVSLGDFCYDGTVTYQRCIYCGDSNGKTITREHTALSEVATFDLKDYGYCGGTVTYFECACGCKSKLTVSSLCKNTEVTESTVENGSDSYITSTKKCIDCGFTTCEESGYYDIYTLYEKTTVYISDEIILEKIIASNAHLFDSIIHKTLLEFELLGESCIDGVIVSEKCEVCAYEYKYITKGHITAEIETTHFGEGECGIDVVAKRCPCGCIIDITIKNKTCDFIKTNASEHFGYDVSYANSAYKCETCGLSYFFGYVWKSSGETKDYVKLCSVKLNGETLLELQKTQDSVIIESNDSLNRDILYEIMLPMTE